jgi:hypothetical protein
MRTAIRTIFVAAMATGAFAAAAAPGGAGVSATNTVTIEKEVVGTAPAGTTFTVELDCQSSLGPAAAAAPNVSFDAAGDPTSDNTFTVPAGQTCTATETVDGGASSTSYACEITRGTSDQIGPPFLGNCTGDNEVTFTDVIGDAATITVTNTFEPTPTTTTQAPATQPATAPAPQAVRATPTFTG